MKPLEIKSRLDIFLVLLCLKSTHNFILIGSLELVQLNLLQILGTWRFSIIKTKIYSILLQPTDYGIKKLCNVYRC